MSSTLYNPTYLYVLFIGEITGSLQEVRCRDRTADPSFSMDTQQRRARRGRLVLYGEVCILV